MMRNSLTNLEISSKVSARMYPHGILINERYSLCHIGFISHHFHAEEPTLIFTGKVYEWLNYKIPKLKVNDHFAERVAIFQRNVYDP